MKKIVLYIGGLLLALGGPISLFSASDAVDGVKKNLSPTDAVAQNTATPTARPANAEPAPLLSIGAPASPSLPMPSLAEVLRFDVTAQWVVNRWPRVSTGLGNLEMQRYRVSLVTGTTTADVAGSLTYYFNSRQQVQRITLFGSTGDPSMLVNVVTQRHGFVRRLTNDPGVVLYEVVDQNNRPAGSLKIRSASEVSSDRPYSRYVFELTMERVERPAD